MGSYKYLSVPRPASFKYILFYFTSMTFCLFLSVNHMLAWCSQRLKEGIGSLEPELQIHTLIRRHTHIKNIKFRVDRKILECLINLAIQSNHSYYFELEVSESKCMYFKNPLRNRHKDTHNPDISKLSY